VSIFADGFFWGGKFLLLFLNECYRTGKDIKATACRSDTESRCSAEPEPPRVTRCRPAAGRSSGALGQSVRAAAGGKGYPAKSQQKKGGSIPRMKAMGGYKCFKSDYILKFQLNAGSRKFSALRVIAFRRPAV